MAPPAVARRISYDILVMAPPAVARPRPDPAAPISSNRSQYKLWQHDRHPRHIGLYIGVADGMSFFFARVWACRYSKRPPLRGPNPRNGHAVGDADIEPNAHNIGYGNIVVIATYRFLRRISYGNIAVIATYRFLYHTQLRRHISCDEALAVAITNMSP